jgi:outer membrane protein TolC
MRARSAMRERLCRAHGLALASTLVGAGAVGVAQERVRLDVAITSAIARNPAIVASRSEYDVAIADATAARQPFDVLVRPFISASTERPLSAIGAEGLIRLPTHREVGSGLSVLKTLRSGMALDGTLAVDRADMDLPALGQAEQVSADVRALVPLRYGRGGGLERVTERAAQRTVESRALDLRHAHAQLALAVAVAYWRYAAATERLAVLELSEQRAGQLVSEIEVLIKADERPSSDADALRASLASRRAQRTFGEQERLASQYGLGQLMGLPALDIARLGPPALTLPDARETAAPAFDASAFVSGAAARRDDLRGAQQRIVIADLLRTGARESLRARVDLRIDLGYVGSTFGRELPGDFRGWRGGVTLLYEPFVSASDRRALALRRSAALRQQTADAEALARDIEGTVALAASAVGQYVAEVGQASEAVRWSKAAVETEKKRLQLGLSTVFSTIQAEDSLTSALLREIDARQHYAIALADLQFASGRILVPSARDIQVNLPGLLAPVSSGALK